jgi:hypothetical protein
VHLLLLQDFARWKGTYGGMIRSNLHGAEIPIDGCCDPAREKEKLEASTKNKEGCFTRDTPTELDRRGFFLSTRTLTL